MYWCDGCGENIDFSQIHDGPNAEWLCGRCACLPQWQTDDEEISDDFEDVS